MNRTLDLKKEQEVFIKIEEMSNRSRSKDMSIGNIDAWVFKGVVLSVGRKYINVKVLDSYNFEIKFEIDTDYREHYVAGGSNYKLYLSKQDIIDEKEADDIYDSIKSSFGSWKNNNKYSLEELKEIIKIIKK